MMHRREFLSLLSGGVAAVAAAIGLRSLPKLPAETSEGPIFVDTGWVCVDGNRMISSDTMTFNGGDPSNPPRPIPMAEWRNYSGTYTDGHVPRQKYLCIQDDRLCWCDGTGRVAPVYPDSEFRDAWVDLSRLLNA